MLETYVDKDYLKPDMVEFWKAKNIRVGTKVWVSPSEICYGKIENPPKRLYGTICYLGTIAPRFDIELGRCSGATVDFYDKGKTWDRWKPLKVGDEVQIDACWDWRKPDSNQDWVEEPVKVIEVNPDGFCLDLPYGRRFYESENITWRRVPPKEDPKEDPKDKEIVALKEQVEHLTKLTNIYVDQRDTAEKQIVILKGKIATLELEKDKTDPHHEELDLQAKNDQLKERLYQKNRLIENLHSKINFCHNTIDKCRNECYSKQNLLDLYLEYRDQIKDALINAGYDVKIGINVWTTALDIIKNNPWSPKNSIPLKVGDRVQFWGEDWTKTNGISHQWSPPELLGPDTIFRLNCFKTVTGTLVIIKTKAKPGVGSRFL